MAKDAPKPDAGDTDGDATEAPPKKGWTLKSLLMFVVAPLVLVLGLGGAAAFFLLGGESEEMVAEGGAHGAEHGGAGGPGGASAPGVFFDMPEVIVNLSGGGGRPAFLKLVVALELDSVETQKAIEPLMPRLIDNFQVYLRELRLDDLQGSAGMFRLKEELVRRVNLAVAPHSVRDVLFKEMIIQ